MDIRQASQQLSEHRRAFGPSEMRPYAEVWASGAEGNVLVRVTVNIEGIRVQVGGCK